MRTLIASGMLGLLVLPAAASEKPLPDLKAMRVSFADADATPNALMDGAGSLNEDFDVLRKDSMFRPNADPQMGEAEKPEAAMPAPEAKVVVFRPMSEVCDAVKQSAKSNNLPVSFFIRLLHQESGFRPDVVSHAGAQGVAQFMPETASRVGLQNPFDPLQAIPASARLLRDLLQQFGNIGLAAAAYNAGPRRVQDWLASKNRKAKLPDETQGYVRTITGKPVENWKGPFKLVSDNRPVTRAPCKPDGDEIMQVADTAPEPKGKLAKLANGLKVALKHVSDVKSRMASKERPVLLSQKKDNARIVVAEHSLRAKTKANAMLAKRAVKAKPVKIARAG